MGWIRHELVKMTPVEAVMKTVKRIRAVFETAENSNENAVILISGTPGTGKSTILQKIQKSSPQVQILNISELVKREGLHDGYDSEFDTFIINDRKTQKKLRKLIPAMRQRGSVLIECHSLGLFDEDDLEGLVDRVIVLTCSTEILYDRLKSRGYSKKKIEENMECEIMRVCADESREIFRGEGVVEEMRNDTKEDQKSVMKGITKLLNK